MGLFFSGASRDGFPVTIVTSPSSGISAANTGHPAVAGQQVRGLKSGLCDGLGPIQMLLNCDRECRAGSAVAASPRRRRPVTRPRGQGRAGLFMVPGCHSSAGEQQRFQSVQWFGRGCGAQGGAHGGARGAVRRGQRVTVEGVSRWVRCLWCPGIGRMRRSNPRSDRRPTLG